MIILVSQIIKNCFISHYSGQYALIVGVILVMLIIGFKLRKIFRLINSKKQSDFVEEQVNLLKAKTGENKNKPFAPLLPV